MKRYTLLSAVLLAAVVSACADDPSQPQFGKAQMAEAEAITNTYLVRFKKDIPATFAADVAALGGEVIFAHAGVGIAAVAGLIPSSAATLATNAAIAAVDEDAYTQIEEPAAIELDAASLESAEPASPADPTLAAFYGRQLWNMNVINAPAAWAAGKQGVSTVKVGVLDTGIDYLHPDLAGRVDLTLSRSFLSAAENARVPAGAHLVADLNYHGTHVASTIASNNWIAAGVTSNITLVGLKVCAPGTAANGFQGTCPTSGTRTGGRTCSSAGTDTGDGAGRPRA